VTETISLGCSNSSPIGLQSILSADLTVCAPEIAGGASFEATLSGVATFPVSFLDAAQDVVNGGLRQAILTDAAYIVQVRSGATQDDGENGVRLEIDPEQVSPGLTQFCTYPPTTVCTADSDCTVPPCKDAVVVVDVPSSDDCEAGGVCDMLGKADGETSQCGKNGFCVTGDLNAPLKPTDASFTADASGEVLFGWADQGLSNSTYDEMTMLFSIPKPNALAPIEQGLKVDAGLVVAVECVMGTDLGPEPGNEENDLVGLTADEDLISYPIVE
jgi:hypothetical protein